MNLIGNMVKWVLVVVFAIAFFVAPVMFIANVLFNYGDTGFWEMVGVMLVSSMFIGSLLR